jgi:hypothetical protein
MIYTFGDSFTKFHWPTWSDWLSKYTNEPVTNLAYIGYHNQLNYNLILERAGEITANDTVYVMWNGGSQPGSWYDQEWVDNNDRRGFFPTPSGDLHFSTKPWQGMWSTHPECMPSFTEMMINDFDVFLKTQMLLDRIGCKHFMMFGKNPWLDVRAKYKPTYERNWHTKHFISKEELARANDIISLSPMRSMIDLINWDCVINAPKDPTDPGSYHGLWEYMLSDKSAFILNHNNDHHPNTLIHHNWVVEHMVCTNSPAYKQEAEDLANQYQSIHIPPYSAPETLCGFNTTLLKTPG